MINETIYLTDKDIKNGSATLTDNPIAHAINRHTGRKRVETKVYCDGIEITHRGITTGYDYDTNLQRWIDTYEASKGLTAPRISITLGNGIAIATPIRNRG